MATTEELDSITGQPVSEYGYKKIVLVSGSTTYTCKTKKKDAADSDPVWQIRRTVAVSSTRTEDVWANDGSGEFEYKISERTSYFNTPPFNNSYSLQFDGVNDRVDVPHDASIDFDRLDTWSYSWWQKTTDTTSYTIFDKHVTNTGTRIYVLGSGDLEVRFRATGTGDRLRVNTVTVPTATTDGSWHHFAVTYDGSSTAAGIKFYIDTVQYTVGHINPVYELNNLNDTLTGSTLNAGVFTLGARVGGGNYFKGNLDEFSVWDGELSQADVTEMYGTGIPTNLALHSNGSLVSWWRLGDGDTYPDVEDSESTNDGAMLNMTAGDFESEVP